MASLEFWTRVRAFANGKVREAWMNRYGHERRCPVCDRWTSETGGARSIRQDGDWHEIMTCDGCGGESRWDCRGMLPELALPDAPMPWEEISPEGQKAIGALIKAVRRQSTPALNREEAERA
ncbi:hypothetical protein [Methylorubrum populi]